jgi:hypothetical protein
VQTRFWTESKLDQLEFDSGRIWVGLGFTPVQIPVRTENFWSDFRLDRKFNQKLRPIYSWLVGTVQPYLISSSSSTNLVPLPWPPLLLSIHPHRDFPPLILQIYSTTSIPSCSGCFSPRGFPFEDLLWEDFGLLLDFLYLKFFPFLGQGYHVFG